MNKRAVFICIIFLVFLVSTLPLLAACSSSPSPSTTQTSTSTQTPTATPTTKPTQTQATTTVPTSTPTSTPTVKPTQAVKILKYAHYNPKGIPLGDITTWMADEIAKRTNGRIKVDIYFAESLVKAADIPDAVKSGLADMGSVVPAYKPAALPMFNIGGMPYNTSNMRVFAQAFDDISKNVPALQAEAKNMNTKFLSTIITPDFNLGMTKPITTLDDIKGKKIRTHGDLLPKLMQGIGAVPVGMTAGEVYEALQRKTVDGIITYEDALYGYNWYEAAKYYVYIHAEILSGSFVGMNLNTWNSLSPEDQRIFEDVSKEQVIKLADMYDVRNEKIVAEMKTKGFTIITLPVADVARLKALAMPLWDDWAKDMNAKGYAGTEVLTAWKAALAKYEQQAK